VVEDDGEEDDDEWSKLGDLIVEAEVDLLAEAGQQAEVGQQAEADRDEWSELSELIVQAEEGLQVEEDTFYSQIADDIDAAEATYYRQVGTTSAGEPRLWARLSSRTVTSTLTTSCSTVAVTTRFTVLYTVSVSYVLGPLVCGF
jgi:hypothetical protein